MGNAFDCQSVRRTTTGQTHVILGYVALTNVPATDLELFNLPWDQDSTARRYVPLPPLDYDSASSFGFCSSDSQGAFTVPLIQTNMAKDPQRCGNVIIVDDIDEDYLIQDVDEVVIRRIDGNLEEGYYGTLCYIMDDSGADTYCSSIDNEMNHTFYLTFAGLVSTQFITIFYPILIITWMIMFVFIIKAWIKKIFCKKRQYRSIPKIEIFDQTTDNDTEIDKN